MFDHSWCNAATDPDMAPGDLEAFQGRMQKVDMNTEPPSLSPRATKSPLAGDFSWAGLSASRGVDRVDIHATTRCTQSVPFHSSIMFVCVEELQGGCQGNLGAIPRRAVFILEIDEC